MQLEANPEVCEGNTIRGMYAHKCYSLAFVALNPQYVHIYTYIYVHIHTYTCREDLVLSVRKKDRTHMVQFACGTQIVTRQEGGSTRA